MAWRDSSIHRRLASLRPRWAWVTLAFGLPWLLVPSSRVVRGTGCLWSLSGLAFWVAALVLGFLGMRWLWRRLLFKVSRRLWVILLLVSFLPAFSLTALFVSVGWLGLGAQVGRAFQGNLKRMEAALREAVKQPSDAAALKALEVLGEAHVRRVDTLPEGVKDGFVGYVYDVTPSGRRVVALRAVAAEGTRYRLLSLGLGRMSASGREIWGGRMAYRLDWGSGEEARLRRNSGRRAPPSSSPACSRALRPSPPTRMGRCPRAAGSSIPSACRLWACG